MSLFCCIQPSPPIALIWGLPASPLHQLITTFIPPIVSVGAFNSTFSISLSTSPKCLFLFLSTPLENSRPLQLEQNTYILKINVVLDLMINTHLGEILRVRISMSLSLAPTFSYHSRGETITSFRPLSCSYTLAS